MTNCSGIGGSGNGTRTVDACGPLFVSDSSEAGDNRQNGDVIQGIISQVIID